MKSAPSRPQCRAAFTLIELLTVIAIIGILAAIIIPTVGRVRASARSAQCKSNLRQIGVAAAAWSADNKDYILTYENGDGSTDDALNLSYWTGTLAPYMGWQSPSASATKFASVESAPSVYVCPAVPGKFGYAYNYRYLSWPGHAFVGTGGERARYSDLSNPARTVMICDVNLQSDNDGSDIVWQPYVRTPIWSDDYHPGYRHPGDTANVLWCDGHVSAEKKTSPFGTDVALWKRNPNDETYTR